MGAQDEEDARIWQEISDAGWCFECDMPQGEGSCEGCRAVEVEPSAEPGRED